MVGDVLIVGEADSATRSGAHEDVLLVLVHVVVPALDAAPRLRDAGLRGEAVGTVGGNALERQDDARGAAFLPESVERHRPARCIRGLK